MSTNVNKLGLGIGAFLLLTIALTWAQNTCTNVEGQRRFICRGSDTYSDCSIVANEDAVPDTATLYCQPSADGARRLCGMNCDVSCVLPTDPCLAIGTTCLEKGRLANPNNCREYYLCYATGATFTRYSYTCSGYYDAAAQVCTKSSSVCESRPVLTTAADAL